jgi:hypothetical protein
MELTALRRELLAMAGNDEYDDFLAILTAYDKFREAAELLELEVRAFSTEIKLGGVVCDRAKELVKTMLGGSLILNGIVVDAVIEQYGTAELRKILDMKDRFTWEQSEISDLDDHPF